MSRMAALIAGLTGLILTLATQAAGWLPEASYRPAPFDDPTNCTELYNDPGSGCLDYCQIFSLSDYEEWACMEISWNFSGTHGECEQSGIACTPKKSCKYTGTVYITFDSQACPNDEFYFCGTNVDPSECGSSNTGFNWGTGGSGIAIQCGNNAELYIKKQDSGGDLVWSLVWECCMCLALGGGGGL